MLDHVYVASRVRSAQEGELAHKMAAILLGLHKTKKKPQPLLLLNIMNKTPTTTAFCYATNKAPLLLRHQPLLPSVTQRTKHHCCCCCEKTNKAQLRVLLLLDTAAAVEPATLFHANKLTVSRCTRPQ